MPLPAAEQTGDSRETTGTRSYEFQGPITLPVLENYLSRAVQYPGLLDCHPEGPSPCFEDDLRMIRNTGAKFIGRAAYAWGMPEDDEQHFANALGYECCPLFVPGQYVADGTLVQSVIHGQTRPAWNAGDDFNALSFQQGHEKPGSGGFHSSVAPPWEMFLCRGYGGGGGAVRNEKTPAGSAPAGVFLKSGADPLRREAYDYAYEYYNKRITGHQ